MEDLNFYSPLQQKKHEQALFHIAQTQCNSSSTSDFTRTAWDLVRSCAIDTQTDETCTGMGSSVPINIDDLVSQIDHYINTK